MFVKTTSPYQAILTLSRLASQGTAYLLFLAVVQLCCEDNVPLPGRLDVVKTCKSGNCQGLAKVLRTF